MKKTIALIALLIISATVFGQNPIQNYTCTIRTHTGTTTTVNPVTTTDADTVYLYPSANGDGSFKEFGDVTYSWTAVPSVTGTTTSGTVIIAQGSSTGTHARYGSGDWVNLISDATQSAVIAPGQTSDALPVHISGSTTLYGYIKLPKIQLKYSRLVIITTGTQTSRFTSTVQFRKHG
jgi:hypothetical protein